MNLTVIADFPTPPEPITAHYHQLDHDGKGGRT
jgi:hypothetical protein